MSNEKINETDLPTHVPRVSIGLPVYNGAAQIERALDALLSQTYTDFELIISDNGSTDRTQAICEAYAQRDPRIRYERQAKNMGLYWNCNRVAEMARGRYFKWSSADVLHAPTFLEKCVGMLDADETMICCHTRSDYIDDQGNRLHGVDPSGDARLGTSATAHRRYADVLFNHGWGARSFALIRREPLCRTGLLADHYGWEKIVMAGLALCGRYHMIDEVLFFEQDHETVEAGRDGSVAGQAESDLPSTHDRDGRGFNRLAFMRGYLKMAWRFSPSRYTTLRCVGWVCLYPLQVSKWRRLTGAAMRRSSLFSSLDRFSPQCVSGSTSEQREEAV